MSTKKSIINELVNKVRVKFSCNPNGILINPNTVFHISSFSFKQLKTCYQYESEYVELCKLILNKVMEYFPEYIQDSEKLDYFINYSIYDFYNVLENFN